jgi:hypothetical protein
MIVGGVGLISGNMTRCFMTHGTIIQFIRVDGCTFIIIIIIIIIHEGVSFTTLRRQQTASNSSSLQLKTKAL